MKQASARETHEAPVAPRTRAGWAMGAAIFGSAMVTVAACGAVVQSAAGTGINGLSLSAGAAVGIAALTWAIAEARKVA